MVSIDSEIVVWLNGWVGSQTVLDAVIAWVISDYLVPVASAMGLLWLWFSGADPTTRKTRQLTVFAGVLAVGIVNLVVALITELVIRPRPFSQLDLELLFYAPTDPSFPANPVAVIFAIGSCILICHRRLGWMIYAAGLFFALGRIYAGVFYPTDVLAGVVIGVGVAGLARLLIGKLEPIPTLLLRLGRLLCLT